MNHLYNNLPLENKSIRWSSISIMKNVVQNKIKDFKSKIQKYSFYRLHPVELNTTETKGNVLSSVLPTKLSPSLPLKPGLTGTNNCNFVVIVYDPTFLHELPLGTARQRMAAKIQPPAQPPQPHSSEL